MVRLKWKQNSGLLSIEDERMLIILAQCIRAAGYDLQIDAVAPHGCLFTTGQMKTDISKAMQIVDDAWEAVYTPRQLFDSLTEREKQLLELLAMNKNSEVAKVTGFKFNYIKKKRTCINFKTHCSSPAMLRAFYYMLLQAGIKIPSWNVKMKKKIRVS